MINLKSLGEINSKLESKNKIEEALRNFQSNYVEVTVGLIEVNSASKHEAKHCSDATWLHSTYPVIEATLKSHCVALLKVELGKIEAWLSGKNVE